MLPPAGVKRSLLSNWSTIMRRLTLFRPGFAGIVFFWLLFLVGLPLLSYWGVRLLAVASTADPRRLAVGLMAVAVLGSAIWAITTFPFDSPDESEHFAYTESLVETGRAPSATPNGESPYATDEAYALGAIDHFSFIEFDDTRPPWFGLDQREYEKLVARLHPVRNDGGGVTAATGAHAPLYYSLLIPGYVAGRGGGVFTSLFWMRLTSALLGAIVVLATFLTLRELLPSRPVLAVAGGLLVAFQPMFSFLAGAVNNDNGVNAMAALAVYLTVRILRRGPTLRVGIALGLVLGVMPLMKGTGFALFPAIALALLAALVQRRSRTALLGVLAAAAGFADRDRHLGPVRTPLRPGRAAATGRHDPVHQQWVGWRHQRQLGRIGEPHRLSAGGLRPEAAVRVPPLHPRLLAVRLHLHRSRLCRVWLVCGLLPAVGLQRRALDDGRDAPCWP